MAFHLALTGDSCITRPLSIYDDRPLLEVRRILRGADAAFTNVEMLFHDYESYPAHESGGSHMRAEPRIARELTWLGLGLGSLATNHTGDYGVEGMRLTARYLEEAGMVHAGAGESLAEAREARYLDTAGGRVGLVAAAASFPAHSRAGRPRGAIPPRPGLSPLRHSRVSVLPRQQLEMVRGLLGQLGLKPPAEGDELTVPPNLRLVAGDRPAMTSEPHPGDLEEIVAVVGHASSMADHVLVSLHTHQTGKDRFTPAEFFVTFAHRVIDAGAAAVVGHGPHVLNGVEIYRGRPIFYSLGNFVFQYETIQRLPDECFEPFGLGPDAFESELWEKRQAAGRWTFPDQPEAWRTVIAVPAFEGAELAGLKIYPVEVGHGLPRPRRGTPRLAGGAVGREILDRFAELSRPLGTEIEIANGVGRVKLPQRRAA